MSWTSDELLCNAPRRKCSSWLYGLLVTDHWSPVRGLICRCCHVRSGGFGSQFPIRLQGLHLQCRSRGHLDRLRDGKFISPPPVGSTSAPPWSPPIYAARSCRTMYPNHAEVSSRLGIVGSRLIAEMSRPPLGLSDRDQRQPGATRRYDRGSRSSQHRQQELPPLDRSSLRSPGPTGVPSWSDWITNVNGGPSGRASRWRAALTASPPPPLSFGH